LFDTKDQFIQVTDVRVIGKASEERACLLSPENESVI
jgi:hypothetical protein